MSIWRALRLLSSALTVMLMGCAGAAKLPASPAQVDIELANSESAANSAYSHGALSDAAMLYRRALSRARAMDDPASISQTAYNAAVCEMALGHYDPAQPLLEEARGEAIRAGGPTADVLLVMARLAWFRGKAPEALSLCGQVMQSAESKPTDEHRGQVHLLRGQIACDKGDVAGAESELAEAKKLAGAAPTPARAAGLENLSGLTAQRRGNSAKAAASFDREAEDYRKARLFRDMARALARAATAWEAAGESKYASDRFFRAGRSALSQGDTALGQQYLRSAQTNATKAGDQSTLIQIRSLIGDAGPPQ